jgi:hypothetical protein
MAMYLVLAMLVVLAPSLGALAVVGHDASAKFQVGRYALLAIAAWLAASLCLYGLLLWSPGLIGSDLATLAGGARGFITLAAVCFVPFILVASVLYCWGAQWSTERHVAYALALSVGAAALAIPLTLLSTCAFQGNCL